MDGLSVTTTLTTSNDVEWGSRRVSSPYYWYVFGVFLFFFSYYTKRDRKTLSTTSFGHHLTQHTQRCRIGLETLLEPLLLVCVSYYVATHNAGTTNRARPANGRGRVSRDDMSRPGPPLRYDFVLFFSATILMIIDYIHFYL